MQPETACQGTAATVVASLPVMQPEIASGGTAAAAAASAKAAHRQTVA